MAKSFPYIFLLIFVLASTLTAGLFSYNLPLDVLENLAWGNLWQWGYYKHPPLQAWQQEAMVLIFGRKDWPAFLLSYLNIAIALYFLYKIARQIAVPLWLCYLMLPLGSFIYYYNLRGIEFNANVATLPLWTAYISCFITASENRQKIRYWLLLGLIAGLGLLAKYSFGVLLFISLPSILWIKRYRSLLWHIGPYISVVVMCALIYPHVNWLIKTSFFPFRYIKQSTKIALNNWEYWLNPLLFILLQIAVILPSIAALYLMAKNKGRKNLDDKTKLTFSLVFLPLFLFASLGWFFPSGVRVFWGYTLPLVLLLGVAFFTWEQRENFIKKAYSFSAMAIILPCIAYMIIIIAGPYVSDKGRRVDYDGPAFAQMAQDYWAKHTGQAELPDWIVTNSHWAGENISWYSPKRPKLIYAFAGKYGYGWSPWVRTKLNIRQKDLKLLWVNRVDLNEGTPTGFCLSNKEKVSFPWKNKKYSRKREFIFAIYTPCTAKKKGDRKK